MVTHKLDLRIHPYFIWHVTGEVACEFFTGIKGGTVSWSKGERIVSPEGVVFRYEGKDKWSVIGFSPNTVRAYGANLQEDLLAAVKRIIAFAEVINNRVEVTYP